MMTGLVKGFPFTRHGQPRICWFDNMAREGLSRPVCISPPLPCETGFGPQCLIYAVFHSKAI